MHAPEQSAGWLDARAARSGAINPSDFATAAANITKPAAPF
jgi:hypothetical protein